MNNEGPVSHAVEDSWEDFRRTILSAMEVDALEPSAIAFSRASFYFGGLSLLEIVETIMSAARSEEAKALALRGVRREIEAFIAAQGSTLN